jgi:hypothetical protein
MKQPHERLHTNAGERNWSTPQVIDLDDRRAVEGGTFASPENFSPAFFSLS